MGDEATYDHLNRSWDDVKFIYVVVFHVRHNTYDSDGVFTRIDSVHTDPERALEAMRATGYSESCFNIIVKELNRNLLRNPVCDEPDTGEVA